MEAGLDVLLEKPMVMNAGEARGLITAPDRTGRRLVVAFPGSLSPQIRTASAMLRSGELGRVWNISATVWQNWGSLTVGTWRQNPVVSGGGFLFDTGAHMLNTIADLAGEDFASVAAWLDDNDRPVDTRAAVMGRLASGVLVTMNGSGEAIPSCASDVRVFCEKAILRTGVWGERLEIQRAGAKHLRKVKLPASLGVWEQFLAVRGANGQPLPTGGRFAYGPAVGCDRDIGRTGRAARQAVTWVALNQSGAFSRGEAFPGGSAATRDVASHRKAWLTADFGRNASPLLHSSRKILGVTSVRSRRPAVKRRRSAGPPMTNAGTGLVVCPRTLKVLQVAVIGRDEDDACLIVPGGQQPPQNLIEGRQKTQGGGHILAVSGIIAQPVFEEGEIIAGRQVSQPTPPPPGSGAVCQADSDARATPVR